MLIQKKKTNLKQIEVILKQNSFINIFPPIIQDIIIKNHLLINFNFLIHL